jgi:hypothetical protein
MKEIPLDVAADLVRGALRIEQAPTGITPVRLSERGFLQIPDLFTREVFRHASGVRLAFTTESAAIEADVRVWPLAIEGSSTQERPVRFDLRVDGADHGYQEVTDLSERVFALRGDEAHVVREVTREPATIRFDGLSPGEKTVELWFPANGAVELAALRVDGEVVPSGSGCEQWIHYGSSISQCAEAHRPTLTWPAVTANRANVELLNLGVAGACHLDQFVARTIRDLPADLISLKIGVNIAGGASLTHRTFGPALHGFIDTVRDGHDQTPILVISPIICPVLEDAIVPIVVDADGAQSANRGTPAGPPVLSLTRMREILAQIVAVRAESGENIGYLDGLSLFGEGDVGELTDGVHPSPAGYVTIGERFAAATFAEGGFFGRQDVRRR